MGNVYEILDWCDSQLDAGIHIPKDLRKTFEDYMLIEDKDAIRKDLDPSPTPEDDKRIKKIIIKDGKIKRSSSTDGVPAKKSRAKANNSK